MALYVSVRREESERELSFLDNDGWRWVVKVSVSGSLFFSSTFRAKTRYFISKLFYTNESGWLG
jgi:hypothetical protein